jgi:hypothetical protein
MSIHKMRFDNTRVHNTPDDTWHVPCGPYEEYGDMERIIGNKNDEKRVKYLIHRGLFFRFPCSITDQELDIHRIMFRHWNGNMDDFIRKMEFGGREDVTRNEIEAWYEARREDEENFENHLLRKFFPDRDVVSWIELDEKRWEHAEEREAAEEAAMDPEYAARKPLSDSYTLLSNTWIMALADVVCWFPFSLGYWLVSLFSDSCSVSASRVLYVN